MFLTLLLGALYLWAAAQPRHPILTPSTYPAAFNDEPKTGGRYYHLHPCPTQPVWTWSNRPDHVYDDFFRITLHCADTGTCHIEVESLRIK